MRSHIKRTHLKAKEQCSVCGGHFKNLDNHVRAMHLGWVFDDLDLSKMLYFSVKTSPAPTVARLYTLNQVSNTISR